MIVLGFYHAAESWHSSTTLPYENVVDDIMIGKYDTNGRFCCYYEFKICWEKIFNQTVPRLKVFSDAWLGFFNDHKELIEKLSNCDPYIGPYDVVEILKLLGYMDLTERELKV